MRMTYLTYLHDFILMYLYNISSNLQITIKKHNTIHLKHKLTSCLNTKTYKLLMNKSELRTTLKHLGFDISFSLFG